MKIINIDHVDYWQAVSATRRGLSSRFGIRVWDGHCCALVRLREQPPYTFGRAHVIPVDIRSLPDYLRILVEEDQANDPTSDLIDVLMGRKRLQDALCSPTKIEPARVARVVRRAHA